MPSVFEHQRREFAEATSPRLPFVSGLGGDVVVSVDAGGLKRVGVGLGVAAGAASTGAAAAGDGVDLAAAVADEHELHLLFEGVHVLDVGGGDAAAAEDADVRERVEVLGGD